jgi:hypothetical protein
MAINANMNCHSDYYMKIPMSFNSRVFLVYMRFFSGLYAFFFI